MSLGDCFAYLIGAGADPGFFNGGWLIQIGNQNYTLIYFKLSYVCFVLGSRLGY